MQERRRGRRLASRGSTSTARLQVGPAVGGAPSPARPLRPRRARGDGHRRQRRPRPARRDARRSAAASCWTRPWRAQAIARLAERLGGIRPAAARRGHRADHGGAHDLVHPRDHDPARPRSARLHPRWPSAAPAACTRCPSRRSSGIARIIVPRFPGNFSALGAGSPRTSSTTPSAPTSRAPRRRAPCSRPSSPRWRPLARGQLERDGFDPTAQRLLRTLDLRYRGPGVRAEPDRRGRARSAAPRSAPSRRVPPRAPRRRTATPTARPRWSW